MSTPRASHTATLLRDGRVLVTGASNEGSATAELYDPVANAWTVAAPMPVRLYGHAATLLHDGQVFISGGNTPPSPNCTSAATCLGTPSNVTERYDPATNTWAVTPSILSGQDHFAMALPDGRVLVVSGTGTPGFATLYDPGTNQIRPASQTAVPIRAVRPIGASISDGRVLVVRQGSTEIYDPMMDRWTSIADPDPVEVPWAVARLADGRIVVIGSGSAADRASNVAIYSNGQLANCFWQTGYCVHGRFLDYWRNHGNLAINGYPLSDEHVETLEDGHAYTVQYFERVRMEYHPENQPPYDVLLGQFGRQILIEAYRDVDSDYTGAIAPVASLPDTAYFPETGHNLGGRFLAYWQAHGGLAQFGYPLTEERWDTLPGGVGACCVTQYFERARFEYHPENQPPYDVLLGQFGRQILADKALLAGSLGVFYQSNQAVHDLLGRPWGAVIQSPGALQQFEHGRMYYAARGTDRYAVFPAIYVLCGTADSGRVLPGPQNSAAFQDTWSAGQDPGGGPAPTPGLYYPKRGFGNVWRDHPYVQNCLGYAATLDEVGFTIAVQPFGAGILLLSDTPEGRYIYVVTLHRNCNGCSMQGAYERFPAPPAAGGS
jgi:hypothetical protein